MLLLNVKESRDNLRALLREINQDDPGISESLNECEMMLKKIGDEIGEE